MSGLVNSRLGGNTAAFRGRGSAKESEESDVRLWGAHRDVPFASSLPHFTRATSGLSDLRIEEPFVFPTFGSRTPLLGGHSNF